MQYPNELFSCYDGAFYLFDATELKKRTEYLRSRLPDGVSICYAVKANTFIIKELFGCVDGFEICSPGEYEICKRLGLASNRAVISGVNKPPQFIENIVADSAFEGILTVESLSQYENISNSAEKYNRRVPVLLRLTNSSQFGINEGDIDDIIKKDDKHLDIVGIQYFSGTQKRSVKRLRRELIMLDELVLRLEKDLGYKVRLLEYGTGFAVDYYDPDGFDEESYLAEFSEILSSMRSGVRISLEIGRSIAASCGTYFTKAVDVKSANGQNYVIVDGGMHQLVYFGQNMGMSVPPVSLVGKEREKADCVYNICGSLCSMNDIIAKQVSLPKVETGDVFAFKNVGAYCTTEGMALFLSRDIPRVYILKDNGEPVLVRDRVNASSLNFPNYDD